MTTLEMWTSLRDSFLSENNGEIKARICELYGFNPDTYFHTHDILISIINGTGVMYICPREMYKTAKIGTIPTGDLLRVGTMDIDFSEPCLVYTLDEFDNSLL